MDLSSRQAWLDERLVALELDAMPELPSLGRALLAADGSDEMEAPAAWASLADKVNLVFSQRRSPRGAGASAKATKALADDARRAFTPAKRALGDPVFDEHVKDASQARGIVETAKAIDADLICVGPRLIGLGDAPGLGSVSETLVHHAPFPVLLARDVPGDCPVVVGLGEEPSTLSAAAWALALAHRLDRRLVALHAAPDTPETLDLDTFEASHGDDEARLIGWPPESPLLHEAEALDPSVIVVGHGRNREWLGSNALQLLRGSARSTLALPWGKGGTTSPI